MNCTRDPPVQPSLVYTKTVDSVERALIGSSNSKYPALFTSEQLGKMASQFSSVASEEIIQNKLFVVHFISVSVASVGYLPRRFAAR